MSGGIEWCDRSDWNPIRGCSRVDQGCVNCYAEAIAARFSGPGLWGYGFAYKSRGGPRWTGQVELVEDRLTRPLAWSKKPARVFVNSASDLFHEKVRFVWLDAILAVMSFCPHLDFLVLTKRPEIAREYLLRRGLWRRVEVQARGLYRRVTGAEMADDQTLAPLQNFWLGTSVSDQESADIRIPELLHCPAALRFVSYEPALGPVDFTDWLVPGLCDARSAVCQPRPPLDWIIIGGESGPGARPNYLKWTRDAIEQCHGAGVPVFVKQLGANAHDGGRLKTQDRKGEDPSEWPADLRVREHPRDRAQAYTP